MGFGVVVKGRMVKGRGGHEYGKRGIRGGELREKKERRKRIM